MEKVIGISKKYKQNVQFDHYVTGFKAYYEDIIKVLPPFKNALDVGTAYGALPMLMVRKGKVSACDMTSKFTSVKMLKDHKIDFFKYNLEKGGKLKDKYDLITMTEVIEHLNSNPLPVIKKLYDALEAGGSLFVATVAKEIHGETTAMNNGQKGLWNDLVSWKDIPTYKGKWKDEHTFHYDQFELISLLTEAGFGIIEVGVLGKFSNYIIGKKER